MKDDLKRTAWCSVSANAVERDQLSAAVTLSGKQRATWMRETLLKDAKRLLAGSKTQAKKKGEG